jgi:hypothetical protein
MKGVVPLWLAVLAHLHEQVVGAWRDRPPQQKMV